MYLTTLTVTQSIAYNFEQSDNSELERTRKEEFMARNIPGVPEENHGKLDQISRCPSRDSI